MGHAHCIYNEPDYKTLFESAPGLCLLLAATSDFTIVAVSDDYLQATHTKREEIIGKGIFNIFADEQQCLEITIADKVRNSFNKGILARRGIDY